MSHSRAVGGSDGRDAEGRKAEFAGLRKAACQVNITEAHGKWDLAAHGRRRSQVRATDFATRRQLCECAGLRPAPWMVSGGVSIPDRAVLQLIPRRRATATNARAASGRGGRWPIRPPTHPREKRFLYGDSRHG